MTDKVSQSQRGEDGAAWDGSGSVWQSEPADADSGDVVAQRFTGWDQTVQIQDWRHLHLAWDSSTAKSLQVSLLFYNTGLNCWLLKQLGCIDPTRVVCICACEREGERMCVRVCVCVWACVSKIVLLLTINDNPIWNNKVSHLMPQNDFIFSCRAIKTLQNYYIRYFTA